MLKNSRGMLMGTAVALHVQLDPWVLTSTACGDTAHFILMRALYTAV
jgi:hypothetical protein